MVDVQQVIVKKIRTALGVAAPPQAAVSPQARGSSDREVLANVAGQRAEGIFSGQRFRATVREMTIIKTMPAAQSRDWGNHDARTAQDKFVIVLADIENIGNGPACCLPEFRLRDSRGRFFSGDTNQADVLVKRGALVPRQDTVGEISGRWTGPALGRQNRRQALR